MTPGGQHEVEEKPKEDGEVHTPDGPRNRDPNYEMNGITVFVHFVRNVKNYMKLKVQCTLYEGPEIVKQDNYTDCNWATAGVDIKN